MPTQVAKSLKLTNYSLKAQPELYELSLFGSHHKILPPQNWSNTTKQSELLGDPTVLTPMDGKEPSSNFKHVAIPLSIKLYSTKEDFYGIYVAFSIEGQEFTIADLLPQKVNLSIEHTLVKVIKGTVGGTTPIGVSASVEGSLSWTDKYTIDKPLITGMVFDKVAYWQFEKQKAQGLPTGDFSAYLSLRSLTDFKGKLEIEVTAFSKRPKNANSKGVTGKYEIDLDSINLHKMPVDDYLFSELQTVKMLDLLSRWSNLKLDGSDLQELPPA